ncbi:MAG: hypothetical protein DPW09_01605 [Anaerolineae bacterium]|nr:hypothetical protein [Anaerolineales bacterium]MCQ3972122.1 hypothetical protein [Anaerolineae bacterium]
MKPIHVALMLISAATLAFQVVLTRFFALAQGHHLAFMAISLALLGAGASGSYLSLRPPTPANLPFIITRGATFFTLSLLAAYLAVNYLPFDAYRLALERSQLLWLTLYYLALTIPFFFSGLVIGAALAVEPGQAGTLYAANLLGSGLGPPLALGSLAWLGGPGTLFLCALLGWLAVVGSQVSGVRCHVSRFTPYVPRPTPHALRFLLYPAITLGLVYLALRPPALFEVKLTPYKSLSQALLYPGSEIIFRRWNAFSRVDVIRSEGIRSAPGLSFAYTGELPPQLGLLVDGDNLSPITRPGSPEFSQHLPLALAFALRPAANTLILEPGGGLAVLTALQSGAGAVTVVQSNHTIVEAMRHDFADFNGKLYSDPRVTVVIDEPRSFLRRTNQLFDLIILPLTDSFRPVTAGAYTLNEDYRYTVEAFADALAHLSPDGLLIVERWLQLPPSESLRLWGTAIAALELEGDRRPVRQAQGGPETGDRREAQRLFALRSLQTSLIGVARSPLAVEDMAKVRQFAGERQFDLIWLPDLHPAETNRFSIVPGDPYHRTFSKLLTTPDPAAFFVAYPYAVAPPTDDHPFFFHFFKWQQIPEILQSLGWSWQPFGGSGYLVLVVLLALVILLSAGLILLPLLWMKDEGGRRKDEIFPSSSFILHPSSFFFYFALLGLGFLFVEIPLLQHFILYLGQPAYAFAVVTSALLMAAGIGSRYLSPRLSLRLSLPLIALLALLYPVLLPSLFDATLRLPWAGRMLVTVLALLPLGTLLGIPFPRGLKLVAQESRELIPWVWAVNGCASVISAVLAAIMALTWGFSVVLWSAALAYGLAAIVIMPGTRRWGLENR